MVMMYTMQAVPKAQVGAKPSRVPVPALQEQAQMGRATLGDRLYGDFLFETFAFLHGTLVALGHAMSPALSADGELPQPVAYIHGRWHEPLPSSGRDRALLAA